MISLANAALKIYVALEPCDMRKGFNGLYASASQHLREGRLGVDQIFVFINKRKDRIKLLYFDGTGLWVAAKRLERGRFSWPAPEKGRAKLRLRPEALQMLLDGVDLRGATLRPWYEGPKP